MIEAVRNANIYGGLRSGMFGLQPRCGVTITSKRTWTPFKTSQQRLIDNESITQNRSSTQALSRQSSIASTAVQSVKRIAYTDLSIQTASQSSKPCPNIRNALYVNTSISIKKVQTAQSHDSKFETRNIVEYYFAKRGLSKSSSFSCVISNSWDLKKVTPTNTTLPRKIELVSKTIPMSEQRMITQLTMESDRKAFQRPEIGMSRRDISKSSF